MAAHAHNFGDLVCPRRTSLRALERGLWFSERDSKRSPLLRLDGSARVLLTSDSARRIGFEVFSRDLVAITDRDDASKQVMQPYNARLEVVISDTEFARVGLSAAVMPGSTLASASAFCLVPGEVYGAVSNKACVATADAASALGGDGGDGDDGDDDDDDALFYAGTEFGVVVRSRDRKGYANEAMNDQDVFIVTWVCVGEDPAAAAVGNVSAACCARLDEVGVLGGCGFKTTTLHRDDVRYACARVP